MTLREKLNPEIMRLLRSHDKLAYEDPQRKQLERQILFLMEQVKISELTYPAIRV